jgi:hypothetical protein
MAFTRFKLFTPLGIAADDALEQTIRRWPPTLTGSATTAGT